MKTFFDTYRNWFNLCTIFYFHLSHDIASESEIMPCNEIDKPLVIYRLARNVMTSIIKLRKRWQNF